MTTTFDLRDGLKIGETVHKECEMREATAADAIDGSAEGEVLRATPGGWVLVQSPALVEMNILRRQIVRVGEYSGPFTLEIVKTLSSFDLTMIRAVVEGYDQAALLEVGQRGRDDPAAGDD